MFVKYNKLWYATLFMPIQIFISSFYCKNVYFPVNWIDM